MICYAIKIKNSAEIQSYAILQVEVGISQKPKTINGCF